MHPLSASGRVVSALGVAAFLSVSVAGQGTPATPQAKPAAGKPASAPASKPYAKRTAWGHPDLQGLWTNTTTTPLERPAAFKDKATLTEAERKAIDAALDKALSAPPPPGSTGAYAAYWFEWGSQSAATSLIVDPPDGRLPKRTAKGEAFEKALNKARYEDSGESPDSYENFDVYDRCITRSMPGTMMPGFYNHNYEIVQTPKFVAIYTEMIHDVRIIPLDGRARLGVDQWLGESRGRWEGDTLVVETKNFKEGAQEVSKMNQTVVGGSRNMVLTERFRRVDANTIDYKITVTDPDVFSAPWTVSLPMTPLKEGLLYEYACHEGNYSLPNMLKGARAEDQTAAKK